MKMLQFGTKHIQGLKRREKITLPQKFENGDYRYLPASYRSNATFFQKNT